MFTGLVREIGRIMSISESRGLTRLQIDAPHCAPQLSTGDSLAVNGICLTAVTVGRGRVVVEAVAETRRITTLARWRSGDRVHLEPAVRAGEPLGGHLVLGHVDGVGRIASLRRQGGGLLLEIAAPPEIASWLLPKGSVAIDGVSLTLDAAPHEGRFRINLIPHTLDATLFGGMRKGDAVNLEADILAKAATGRDRLPPSPADEDSHGGRPGLSVQDILARGFRRSR